MMMNLIKDCITFFQAGGVFMYPLAACSVLLIAAVIYRMFNMKKSLICPVVLTRAVEQYTRGAVGRTELERIAADSVPWRPAWCCALMHRWRMKPP